MAGNDSIEHLSGTTVETLIGETGQGVAFDEKASSTSASKQADTSAVLRHKHSVSSGIEDVVLAKIDEFLTSFEAKIESWEHYSAAVLDDKVAHAHQVVEKVKNDVLTAGRRRAEAFLKVLDQYHVNADAGAPLVDRVNQGLEYFDSLLGKVEDSHAAHSIQRALTMARERLLTFDELPVPWRCNPYIVNGYRFCKGPAECLTSALQLHNETCNIWTHLGGFFVLLGMAFFHLPSTDAWQSSTWVDRLPMMVFLGAALKCLMCSAVWHTFCNVAHVPLKQQMACVDYMGITVLITASVLSTEYAALYCHPIARTVYMTITFISGIYGVLFTWSPRFDTVDAKLLRVSFFSALALAGVFAGFHAMFYDGVWPVLALYLPVVKSLLAYGVGIIFYALNIPERFLPGSIFDYFGMSHNLWHLCVFAGIYYHYAAAVLLIDKVNTLTCAA